MNGLGKWRLLSLIAIALLLAGCSKEAKQTEPVTSTSQSGTSTAPPAKEAETRNNTMVRVINTAPTNQAFDIFADDQKIFEKVGFKAVTPYQELPDTRHVFRVRPVGQNNAPALAENSEGLSSGKHYTILVMPDTNDKLKLRIVSDNLTPPPAEKAQLRIINASPEAGDLDVLAKQNNKVLFSDVNAGTDTSYINVDPMASSLEIRPGGKDNTLLTVPNAKFDKGKIYTLVVAGRAKGEPKLQALMIEDKLGTNATASETQKEKDKAAMQKVRY